MGHIILPGNSAFASMRNTTNTKLLIHSDTTDGSTTFADSSTSGHTVDVGAADVAHDTAQKKFGKTSILFDGDSGYLSIDDHADWFMTTGAFTIDWWVRFNSLAASVGFFDQYESVNDYAKCFLAAGNLGFIINDTALTINFTVAWAPVVNTWYHMAVIRGWGGNANDWALTVNGIALATQTDASPWHDLGAVFRIGYSESDSAYLNGWMDEFRVVKGEAMWTTQFTPPIGPYT